MAKRWSGLNPGFSGVGEESATGYVSVPVTTRPQQGNITPNSVLQLLLTLYAICVERGCRGYATTINDVIRSNRTDDPNHYTEAQVDRANRAYNACISGG